MQCLHPTHDNKPPLNHCCCCNQAKYLPNVDPANPGKRLDHVKASRFRKDHPDHFTPYQGFGFKPGRKYGGTLFRLPLRTPAAAEASELSKRAHSVEATRSLLQDFAREAQAMLLFLVRLPSPPPPEPPPAHRSMHHHHHYQKNVECLEVYEFPADAAPGAAPTLMYRSSIVGMTKKQRLARGYMLTHTPAQAANVDFELRIRCEATDEARAVAGPKPAVAGGAGAGAGAGGVTAGTADTADTAATPKVQESTWLVANQMGGGGTQAMAQRPDVKHMRLVPWGGVAARLEAEGEGSHEPDGGHAYCFLPLPTHTHMPVSVNGFFELSSNRRELWWGASDMTGDGALRALW